MSNPRERVEGDTNFLWTFLMAGGIRAGLDPTTLSQALGIGSALMLLRAVWRRGSDLGMTGWWPLSAPAMLAANRAFALWATGGLVVAAAWRLHREASTPPPSPRPPGSSLLLALACLNRTWPRPSRWG